MAVIQEAWINGVSTRKVDELVQAMGMSGISKSSVSKLCKDIDERVNAFLKRSLAGDWRSAGNRGSIHDFFPASPVARRHLSEGARGRAHRLGGGDNRGRRDCQEFRA